MTLYGPFEQIVTLDNLPANGPIADKELELIEDGGVVVENGVIKEIGRFDELRKKKHILREVKTPAVLLPGIIDAHTHLCFAGSRIADYAMRLEGQSYQEITSQGGGILDTVRKTRATSNHDLVHLMLGRANVLMQQGVTTCEVKSGYGLSVDEEIRMLAAICEAARSHPVDIIPTCLAAHTKPWEFARYSDYLKHLELKLLPKLQELQLTKRIDIFVEEGGFTSDIARPYLKAAKALGFSIIVHADQFSRGGALLAAEVGALSADHLEASTDEDFQALKEKNVFPIVLPGATLGLGMPFPHARKILDSGLPLVIASDWNPGTAPMGNLLLQAAVLGAAQKLSMAETWAAITFRAAAALELNDRGIIRQGLRADLIAFPCADYREILYHQGTLMPHFVMTQGTVN